MEPKTLAREIVKVLDKKKAMDIVAIETAEVTVVSDYFIIATGTSNTHAKSLADDVEYELKKLGQVGACKNNWFICFVESISDHTDLSCTN